MVVLIIIFGILYNGIFVVDKIGICKFVKEMINCIGRLSGGKDVDIDLGFF